MTQSTARVGSLVVALLCPVAAAAQGNGSLPTARIFEALALRGGATVCEVGAGDGELSIAAAERVGAQGRVYTSELGDERIKALRAKVAAAGRANIQVVEAAADRTNFPEGACDALFTPRPLGPLHDMAAQTGGDLPRLLQEDASRVAIFAAFLQELGRGPTIAVVEDIHWADEATLDLLKYIGRRAHLDIID